MEKLRNEELLGSSKAKINVLESQEGVLGVVMQRLEKIEKMFLDSKKKREQAVASGPNSGSGRAQRNRWEADRSCYICKEVGHISRTCKKTRSLLQM